MGKSASKSPIAGNGIRIVDRRTGNEFQYRFARSSREAFGSDLEVDDATDNWRWTWPVVLLYVFVVALVIGWKFANAEPTYEAAPNQHTVIQQGHP